MCVTFGLEIEQATFIWNKSSSIFEWLFQIIMITTSTFKCVRCKLRLISSTHCCFVPQKTTSVIQQSALNELMQCSNQINKYGRGSREPQIQISERLGEKMTTEIMNVASLTEAAITSAKKT